MKQQITSAFRHRQRPTTVTNVAVSSTLRDDACHFEGMSWTQVTARDWAEYSDAFTGFSPEAFVYFLPSLLILSLEASNLPLVAADFLVSSLDTSGDPDIWPGWFAERFEMLTSAEIRTLKDWSVAYLANAVKGEGSEFARVQDTLTMLELRREN
jgi:hypothetical protein